MTAPKSRTPRATAKADTESAKAANANSSEMSHKNTADTNAEEAITTLTALMVKDAVASSKNIDNINLQILQNAVTASNQLVSNAVDTANLVNKQAVAHRDIAIDRIWNADEVALAVSALLGRYVERMNNPTPPAK